MQELRAQLSAKSEEAAAAVEDRESLRSYVSDMQVGMQAAEVIAGLG